MGELLVLASRRQASMARLEAGGTAWALVSSGAAPCHDVRAAYVGERRRGLCEIDALCVPPVCGRCAIVRAFPNCGGWLVPLTEQQKRSFVRDGFLHVPGAVPSRLVDRARRAINHSIGLGMDRDDMVRSVRSPFAWSCGRILGWCGWRRHRRFGRMFGRWLASGGW